MDREHALDLALAQIERQFGKGSVMRLGEQTERFQTDVIRTGSIAVDMALGVGGIPRGRVVEIFGPESSGKTTVALHVIAEAQRTGGVAAFIDAEHALDPAYAKRLGVDIDQLLISQPDTGEQALEIAEALVRSGAIDVIVVDSVAALVPRAEIEGEMGDSHVGLQARLMSQALRKLTGAISKSHTSAIFINQIREKVGVMFGCLDYATPVVLGDGRRRAIGRLVNREEMASVLTFDRKSGSVREGTILGWYRNGRAERFMGLVVERPGRAARLTLTPNHPVLTPDGWVAAERLSPGDLVMSVEEWTSETEFAAARGWLLLGGRMRAGKDGPRVRNTIADPRHFSWQRRLAPALRRCRGRLETPDLGETFGREVLSAQEGAYAAEFFERLDRVALAVWVGEGARLEGRELVVPLHVTPLGVPDFVGRVEDLTGARPTVRLRVPEIEAVFEGQARRTLFAALRDHLPDWRMKELGGRSAKTRHPSSATWAVVPRPVTEVVPSVGVRSRQRFDIQVKDSHTFVADGIVVHNSPETTPGGRALKFYASVRMEVRRVEALKQGTEIVGNRTRVRVVKNKVAPPFKVADFDILYGVGISREGSLIDLGVETKIVQKAGAWFSYGDVRLGQGKESARDYLRQHADLADEIEGKIRENVAAAAGFIHHGASPDEGEDESES